MERFLALHPKLIDLSLGRITTLLERLGAPNRRLPPVIHVAGTNGKGSTVAFLRAILEAAGLSVHVYTSPHLVRFHERIRLGQKNAPGQLVDEVMLVDAFERCERANDGAPITVFEMTTAAAFLLFAEHPADILLLEVGLGGEFDATNLIDTVRSSVITPISIDHAEYLGNTIEEIASAKAGIIKAKSPVIVARQNFPNAETVIERKAARLGAPLFAAGQHFDAQHEDGRLIYRDENGLLDLPMPRLIGAHQINNAATAIATLRTAGFEISNEAYERGMRLVEWPARMQPLSRGTLAELMPQGSELWLDGGHNPEGGDVIAHAFKALHKIEAKPLHLIVGMLATKDAQAFLGAFAAQAESLTAIPIPSQKVARTPDEICALAQTVGLQATIADDAASALRALIKKNEGKNLRILITGSLYLAGEILAANGTPPH
ncbi:MAG: bifunctional folylpolyglutamate synthase/dihydrofolate synthase [Alphaproteobacteria bacterium]|nr:bifunctional folylpolyglutamate synthase/dihydrofolate synthase [Alphaproteobacteria bacterium]